MAILMYNGKQIDCSTTTVTTADTDAAYESGYAEGKADAMVGTATPAYVLEGKTFTNSSSVGQVGTMTNNGAVSKTITPSSSAQTYTIPKGYHNGSGKVTVAAVTSSVSTQSGLSASGSIKLSGAGQGSTSVTITANNNISGLRNYSLSAGFWIESISISGKTITISVRTSQTSAGTYTFNLTSVVVGTYS